MATTEGGCGLRIYAFVGAHLGAMGVPGKASSRPSALLQKRSMARQASGGCPRMRCASPFSKGAQRTSRRQKSPLKRFPEFDPESRRQLFPSRKAYSPARERKRIREGKK